MAVEKLKGRADRVEKVAIGTIGIPANSLSRVISSNPLSSRSSIDVKSINFRSKLERRLTMDRLEIENNNWRYSKTEDQ